MINVFRTIIAYESECSIQTDLLFRFASVYLTQILLFGKLL